MNKEEILKDRRELLDRMCEALNDELIAAMIREPEAENEPPILRIVLDDMGYEGDAQALGECFFLPLPDDSPVQHFSSVITIADDLEGANFADLFEAMSYINYALPCGNYAIDKDRQFLSFMITAPLPIELSGEDLYKEIDAVIGNSIALCDVHMDMLLKVMEGKMTVDEVKEMLG